MKLKANNKAFNFSILVISGLALILFFAILNIGTFINGSISSSLVDTYQTNHASGRIDLTYWHNTTTTNTTRNITLPCAVSELNGAISKFYIHANGSAIAYNLTVNGNKVNASSHLASGVGYNHTVTALTTAAALTNTDRYINYTWNVSSNGNRIYIRIFGTYFKSSDYRTNMENRTVNTLENITVGYDNTIEIMVVAAIIMAITLPLAAIVALKKLF